MSTHEGKLCGWGNDRKDYTKPRSLFKVPSPRKANGPSEEDAVCLLARLCLSSSEPLEWDEDVWVARFGLLLKNVPAGQAQLVWKHGVFVQLALGWEHG